MDIIKHFLNFLTDNSKRWSSRALVSAGILFILWLLNDLTGFTYQHSVQSKLQTYEQISKILKDTNITKEDREILLTLRTQSLSRQIYYQKFLSFFELRDSTNNYQNNQNRTPINGTVQSPVEIRNPILMFVSSSFFYLILILVSIIALFTDRKTSFLKSLATISIAIIVVLSVSFVMTYFFWKIPLLGNNAWWNYGLNFLLHSTFVLLMTWLYSWMKSNAL